ncbi:hypothetical protein O181_065899 [Austropuccinia psidii MF-1]|uniref:Uncharacterized protein n=1 Tax=Austropuccinia psidii MF-1 TaxID=1389203 RepID=A0A9Q3ERY5_9BASI|nr:hypothetical protein [Austropuccinia psidii MF-1]
MPKLLAGGHKLLLTHQELSGSGENNRNLRRMDPIVLERQDQKIKNWLKNQSFLPIDQEKELEMTSALGKEGPMASTTSKPAPEMSKDKPKGAQKKKKGPRNNQGKSKAKANWQRSYSQG